jgi:hypothetical protein
VSHGGKVKSDLRLSILNGCRHMGVIASMVVAAKDQSQQSSAPVNGFTLPSAAPGSTPATLSGAPSAAASAPQATGSVVPPIPPLKMPPAAG